MNLSEEEKHDYTVMQVQVTKAMEAMDAAARMYDKLDEQGTLNKILDNAAVEGTLTKKGMSGARIPGKDLITIIKAYKMSQERKNI